MMNFGDYLDGGAPYSMPFGHRPSKTIFKTPGLSLALQPDMEGQTNTTEGQGAAENHASTSAFNNDDNNGNNVVGERRTRDAEEVAGTSNNNNRSRSDSDNMDAEASGDDDQLDASPARKKRFHRHTPQQIQELEALFKECPHPDENQRLELSRRLNLETRQIKFWFQNRRTQMKSQVERQENSLLRQDNDRLRSNNLQISEATRNPICVNCGGPAIMPEPSSEEQRLRIENAQLREELERVSAMASGFIGRPLPPPPMPNAGLELAVGEIIDNVFGGEVLVDLNGNPLYPIEFGLAISSPEPSITPSRSSISVTDSFDRSSERSMWLELALSAMDELVRMAHYDEPLWVKSLEGGKEVLNHEEYQRTFPPCVGTKPNGFVTEASRESGMVIINSVALVETLMDPYKWADMFPCVVARASTTEVISNGMEGTRNGALHLMQAELQVLSPLVPVRDVNFLRFCKQHAEGLWAVVDVAIDTIAGETSRGPSCRRLPSGCVVQDMPNGYSKVTWVEHAQYDESAVHPLYRPLVNSGMGFGAQRWVAALQRESECLAILLSSNTPSADHPAISAGGRRSMLKLAQRMTSNFCAGVCASTYDWNNLTADNVHEGVRFMTRKSVDHGEPSGTVLSATTSVWLPVSPQKLFNFLRDEQWRSEWDVLSDGDPMQEVAHIAKGQDHGNCVSILGSSGTIGNQSSIMILQETCIDAAGLLVVYAPVHIPAMHAVMNGGDSAYVVMLPSGFAIVPDGWGLNGLSNNGPTTNGEASNRVAGSLLTVNFQILVDSPPNANLTVESMETVNNLISCTVHKIKAALHLEG